MKPTESQYLAELKRHVERLNQLLQDPQPGLMSWCMMYAGEMQAIADMWYRPQDRKEP